MRLSTPLLALCTLTALVGCDDIAPQHPAAPACPPGFALDDHDDCVFDEVEVARVMQTFGTSGELVKINADPFMQVMGPGLERNVWVSPVPLDGLPGTAVDLYRLLDPYETDHAELPGPFPVGTLIVHETVNREEGHTVQVKLGDDYEDENGRTWWFGKYFDDGSPDENECSPCTMCHNPTNRPTTDGLYGVAPEFQAPTPGEG